MSLPDERFMRYALDLAARAKGQTRPNPMVGAVVVRGGRIVGKGFHHRAGQPHAEVLALRQAGALARGATLYVSLEPCAHTGRTPPCTEAIRSAGIRRVVAAMIDPNPIHRGTALRWLKAQGIRTTVGVLEEEARTLNRVFVTWKSHGRPFVTIKVAQSLDGKIATRGGHSRWISGPAARRWVHQLRSQVDALLIGVGTVLKDNPRLTARLGVKIAQPLKVILDTHLKTPPSSRIFSSGGAVLIATSRGAPQSHEKKLRRAGAEIMRLPSSRGYISLGPLLKELAHREISHLLVEGGGEVIASAFAARVVDQIRLILAPKIIGGREAPTAVGGKGIARLSGAIRLENVTSRPLGEDLLVAADVSR